MVAAVLSQVVKGQETFNQQQEYENLYALLQAKQVASYPYSIYDNPDIVRHLVVLNDESADQFYCVWGDVDLPDINQGTFKPNQYHVADMWTVLFYAINRCNYFLENATTTDDATLQQRAEARFLRAYFYSVALDLWGGVPIYTSSDGTQTKPRNTASEVFDFVVGELSDCLSALPLPSATVYGKPSQDAARLLMARLYLNAEAYTGTARWADAKALAQTLISDGRYTLCSDYARLFMGDNSTNGAER